ncbi:N-6 DNA methylase [Micromonospora sp. SH-82]|uniref:N-6 DNA methylase n=1 Tax=Micromonospora sp. SH-82 TaxID=3132938 RepID=UPI003EBECA5F
MQGSPSITAAEIARLAGVGRAAVSNWRKRHADFPAPAGGTATSPEFDLHQVEQWLRTQGKLPELSTVDRLWHHLDHTPDTAPAVLAAAGTRLLARHRGEPTPPADPRLGDHTPTVDALADELGPRVAFDELWQRFTAPGPGGRTAVTPDPLADLMAALADVTGGTVLDPAAGTGATLRAAARAGATAAHGQELDPDAARLAALWLALHDTTGEVHPGDSLRADAYAGRTVDAVVCHPPFGASNWGHDELGYAHWEYGTPPRTEPELAWVQHALAHLRTGGHAVLLMPPAAASRRAGRRIRAELLRRGALRAVVALPAGVAAPHGVPLHLWVLRRPAPDAPPPARTLLVDTADGEDLTTLAARVLTTWKAFTADPEADVEQPGFARAVPVIELLDDDTDLTPARRQATAEPARTGEHLIRTRDRLAVLVKELPALIPQDAPTADGETGPTVTVAELSRTGALELVGPSRSGNTEVPLAPGDVLVPMLGRQLTPRVVTAAGEQLGRNEHLLRPNPAALDPWFLAGQLRTSTNEKQTSSLSGTLRFDIRRAQVRRLPLADQRAQGEAFKRLDAFESALREAATLGEELIQLAADGLASGTLRPNRDL